MNFFVNLLCEQFREKGLDFLIGKLTTSIENVVTGESEKVVLLEKTNQALQELLKETKGKKG